MKKRYLTEEELNKIIQAHDSLVGTTEYRKYHMCLEFKMKINGKDKWTKWEYCAWGIPQTTQYYFKKLNGKLYLMSEIHKDQYDNEDVERYEVTDEVKKLLQIE